MRSGICAITFAEHITSTEEWKLFISSKFLKLKNLFKVLILFLFASSAIVLEGSKPITLILESLKFSNKVPSLDPTSISLDPLCKYFSFNQCANWLKCFFFYFERKI